MALLNPVEKCVSGPKCAFPRTRRVSDSKMLPTSGQDSFWRSNNFTRAWKREGVAGAHHSVCRGRSVSRLSPSPSLYFFAQHHSDNMQWGCKSATSAPKSVAGRPWGWETIPFMQPSTIRRYCAIRVGSYFSHPDEEGERQFRFDHF